MDHVQPSTQKDVKNIINGATKGLEQKYNDAAHLIKDKVSDEKAMAQNFYADLASMAKERAGQAVDASSGFIKENPIATVCGAAAVGLAVGYLLARR